MSFVTRQRLSYLVLALGTIVIGLLVHLRGALLGPPARDILGDALWGAMIVWLVSAGSPGTKPWIRYGTAYAVCALVEISQAYHARQLDALRATLIGHLVLGSGFDPRDFLAYACGVAAAAIIDQAIVATRREVV